MIVRRAGPLVCAGVILLSSVGFYARGARAAPLTVTLQYAAGPGCPDAAEFKAVVVSRLGRDPFVEAAPAQVQVGIEPRGRAMDGHIEWRGASGKWSGDQSFPSVSTDCAHLARAMAFALAVQIQLQATANGAMDMNAAAPAESGDSRPRTLDPLPMATRPVPPTALPEGTTDRGVTAAAYPSTRKLHPMLVTGAGPLVGFGISSAPVLLGRLFGAIVWPHVSVELAAVASMPATVRRADGAGFSQQHLLGSAAACATFARWTSCLLANAGEVRMSGKNIDQPTSASVALVETGIRSGINQRLGRRALLNAHADGLVNLTRWTGRLDRLPVWTAPRFAAALGIDVSVQFP